MLVNPNRGLTAGTERKGTMPRSNGVPHGHGMPGRPALGPSETELRQMLREGLTEQEIADKYGFSRGAISYYKRKYNIPRTRNLGVGHKDFLPWTIYSQDHSDGTARLIRWWSKLQKGEPVSRLSDAVRAEEFVNWLIARDLVVDYRPGLRESDPDQYQSNFVFVPRDPERDAPGDIIRRPVTTAEDNASIPVR
jgi:DNA-binding CsgD family transcriptional regulator